MASTDAQAISGFPEALSVVWSGSCRLGAQHLAGVVLNARSGVGRFLSGWVKLVVGRRDWKGCCEIVVYCGSTKGMIVGASMMLGRDFVEFSPAGGVLGRSDGTGGLVCISSS